MAVRGGINNAALRGAVGNWTAALIMPPYEENGGVLNAHAKYSSKAHFFGFSSMYFQQRSVSRSFRATCS